jgi:HK97 gp10 family phage protein
VIDETKKEVTSATLAIESGAIQRSPVDTGNLKSSMAHRFSNGGMGGEVFNSSNYGVHVEYGTYKMAAQPFLFPAHEQYMPNFLSNMQAILKKVN